MFLAAKLYCGRKENLEGRDAQMDVRRRELRRGSERTAVVTSDPACPPLTTIKSYSRPSELLLEVTVTRYAAVS